MTKLFVLSFFLVACGPPDRNDTIDAPPPIDAAEAFPLLRNPIDMPDLELAQAATARMGVGSATSCDQCHSLTRGTFQRWLGETRAANMCLTTLIPRSQAEAGALVSCFHGKNGDYDPAKVGIYAAAAHLGWFDAVFDLDFGKGSTVVTSEFADFTNRVSMPKGGQDLLTQHEFDIVAEWFARGLPRIEAVVSDAGPVTGCTDMIKSEVAAHISEMNNFGWTALNRVAGIAMLGCGTATDPLDCLTSFPLAGSTMATAHWGDASPAAKLRILHSYGYSSSFWTRSSADGRFVAHGGGGGAMIIDLQGNREIHANASYDPGFFPDNSGFVIQGGQKAWCRQSLLESNPAQVSFTEPECSGVTIGLYQHVGAVQGGDYWAVNGQFVSDDAWGEPSADFGASGYSSLTPMLWNGTSYVEKAGIGVETPFEGDSVISPSAKLLLSRTSFNGNQAGFTMRKIIATPSGGSYTVTTPVIGQYCVGGGKPAFSYDERWIVYHHWIQPDDWAPMGYASASDPAFVSRQTAGTSNIFLLDLANGLTHRITNMNPGQAAVFPHFRSDGWIYFVVKDANTPGHESIVASDAGLRY